MTFLPTRLAGRHVFSFMKFLIQRDLLVGVISKIQGVVPSKAVIPILSNVLIEASDKGVVITATDLTVSIRAFAQAKVEVPGAVTLPAKKFFQLVRELTTSEVTLEVKSSGVAVITSGTSHFRLHGMDKDEFPSFPDLSEGKSFHIDASTFKEMLSNTSFAAAKDDSRQVLNGVFMQLDAGKAIMVGTDGKRLAKVEKMVEYDDAEKQVSIIPLKAVEEMIKILDVEQKASITFMFDKIALESADLCLISKLLSGQFPDYGRVIPEKSSQQEITIHREELMTLLKQVSLFTSETNHSVRLSFNKGELTLQAANSEIGEGNVNMPVDYSNAKLDIAFNPQFCIDILRRCRDETIYFGVSDSFSPIAISDTTPENADACFVMMPMRFNAD